MLESDYLLAATSRLVKGLSAQPGIHVADKKIAASYLARALHGMFVRGEIQIPQWPKFVKYIGPADARQWEYLQFAHDKDVGIPLLSNGRRSFTSEAQWSWNEVIYRKDLFQILDFKPDFAKISAK